jgi:hypothetical protein
MTTGEGLIRSKGSLEGNKGAVVFTPEDGQLKYETLKR